MSTRNNWGDDINRKKLLPMVEGKYTFITKNTHKPEDKMTIGLGNRTIKQKRYNSHSP